MQHLRNKFVLDFDRRGPDWKGRGAGAAVGGDLAIKRSDELGQVGGAAS